MAYYCINQKKIVLTVIYIFRHPHLGMRPAFFCRECGEMVILKEEVMKNA